jgi:tungstate transport system substrate-binding protein
MKARRWSYALALLVVALLAACAPTAPAGGEATQAPAAATAVPQEPARLILSTTTSTDDSGLLNYLLPDFEQRYNCQVDVIAVGTGQAIKNGQDGNCDVILVHSRPREDQFVAEGYGINRLDVMYNDFVIVGPEDDPAGIKGMKVAAEAFEKIAAAEASFVSRGDESGTHSKELSIWKEAGLTPEGAWYISAGQGMGAVLTMAGEQQAYTLSDRATYLAMQEKVQLAILVEGDEILFNPYGVIAVNPEKHPGVNADLAAKFQTWLTSLETQEMIAEFGKEEFGQALFTPDSEAWRQAHATAGS